MLVVGFPHPYDAMVRSYNGTEYMILDLIRLGQNALENPDISDGLLTHELLHICIHKKYPAPEGQSYHDNLDYITFNEGFAHALSYARDIADLPFDVYLEEKYKLAREKLREASFETDVEKQEKHLFFANTGGNYWDKFGAIAGMLYVLKHITDIEAICNDGWRGFVNKILAKNNDCR